uniref:histidine kinase n=1 Tax=Magnetococcus massalia (strain MO-1) TaxID=451514 RepID=A0A1S7LLI2_MAGMO|nr:Putative histidine kinase with PAS 4 domain [Candidatus Magnetococcus massalia]
MSIRYQLMIVMFLVTLVISGAFSLLIYERETTALMRGVDDKLITAATMVGDILPKDYHDTITDAYAVPNQQYVSIVDRFNKLSRTLELQYLWSVLVIDEQIRFTSATATSKELKNGDYASFFALHSNPQAFDGARKVMRPHLSTFHNKWGEGRMVLIPKLDSHGRIYMLGASMGLEDLNGLIRQLIIECVVISLLIMLLLWGVTLLVASQLLKPLREIASIAKRISRGDYGHLPELKHGSQEIHSLYSSIQTMGHAMEEQMRHHESFRMLSHAISTSPVATAIFDRDGSLLYFNNRFKKLAGQTLSTDEPALIDQISLGVSSEMEGLWKQQVVHARMWAAVVEIVNDSGDVENERINITPFQPWQEDKIAILVTLQNITKRRQLEDNLRKEVNFQRVLLDTLPIPVFFKDDNGHYLGCNKAFCLMVGRDEGEIIGNSDQQLFEGNNLQAHQDVDSALFASEGAQDYEAQLLDGQGHERLYHFFKAIFHHIDGRPAGMVGAMVDITDRVLFEGKIMQLNIELENRVKERTQDLETSLERVQKLQGQLMEADKMATLGAMVAGVAHEVNSPLGVSLMASTELSAEIKKFADLFHQEGVSEDEFLHFLRRNQELMDLSVVNLTRAGELLRNFKKLAVDQSVEDERVFCLDEQIKAVVESLSYLFKQRPITMQVECPDRLEIISYPGVVSQIITNLITNAVRHGYDPGESGTIILQASWQSQNQLLIRFSDDGKGMEPDVLERMFDQYFTTKKDAGGTGLGMHIVNNLVTQTLQGTLSCESRPGEGTQFKIRFPTRKIESVQ